MNTKIQKIKFNDLSNRVFNPAVSNQSQSVGDLSIARIERMSHHLRIDFIYKTSYQYINGGWISIEQDCYVESADQLFKCILVQADNIAISPKRTYFSTKGQLWHFTLWFTPLPDFVDEINFIEKLNGQRQSVLLPDGSIEESGNYFNFYGIQLNGSKHVQLQLGSN